MRDYEVMFIIDPALEDAKKDATVETVQTIIAADGEVTKVDVWGMRKLAYPIDKKEEGYYAVVEFKGNPTLPKELDRRLKISDNVIRHIIVNKDEKEERGAHMNSVVLIGRLTRDPELRYTSGTQMAVATFTVAIDRPVRAGGEKQTDFPRVTVFGKQAENCEKFLAKGRLVGVQGRLQTGSYTNKDGATVYTTDVVADRVEFLEWGDKPQGSSSFSTSGSTSQGSGAESAPAGFSAIDEDIPF